jgi:hypothetical protein
LSLKGIVEFSYEYGSSWTVKLILLAKFDLDADAPIHCIAGEGLPPSETIDGPAAFKKYAEILETGTLIDREEAQRILGRNFGYASFNIAQCNQTLKDFYNKHKDSF